MVGEVQGEQQHGPLPGSRNVFGRRHADLEPGPGEHPWASRVAWEPDDVVTASTCAPACRARRMAASVSAVSPDWLIAIQRDRGPLRSLDPGSGTPTPPPLPLVRGPTARARVLAHQTGMVRGTAGYDDHLPDVPDGVGSEAKPIKNDPPVGAHPLGEGVGQGGLGCSWISSSMNVS